MYHVSCEHCLSGIHKMSVVVKSQMFMLHHKQIIDDIKRVIDPDSVAVEKDLSLIAVIGQGMGTVKGTFESVFYAMLTYSPCHSRSIALAKAGDFSIYNTAYRNRSCYVSDTSRCPNSMDIYCRIPVSIVVCSA